MCELPKEFKKSTEVLPFTKYGVSTLDEFERAEEQIQRKEWLKRAGLSTEEVKLYQENEAGLLDQQNKIESRVLKIQLDLIYTKINDYKHKIKCEEDEPATSKSIFQNNPCKTMNFYPEGHPMHNIKEIEESLFGHLKNDNIMSITKRRKILRRLERRKERLLQQQKQTHLNPLPSSSNSKAGSLWDVEKPLSEPLNKPPRQNIIGPQEKTLYTIKDNKIVRLVHKSQDEFQAVDIVTPKNKAEERLLEGTKMCLEDIKKIDRFKDYEPGVPSKVLYIKNISSSVTQEKLGLLFNQFQLENGGPIEVKLLSGRMRGQAFVEFQSENIAIQALEEVNGTIMSGRPLIVQFGRNSNRIQNEDNR